MDNHTHDAMVVNSEERMLASTEHETENNIRLRSDLPSPLWLLWEQRGRIRRAFVWSLVLGIAIAFVIPASYRSTTRIMPPSDGAGGLMGALMANRAMSSSGGGGLLTSLAGNLMGMHASGALYVDLLHSRTVQDHIVEHFELQKLYRTRYRDQAIKKLDGNTSVDEDRKSGVISIAVSDHDPARAQALTAAYVDELNKLLAEVSTSAARREREFVEKRLVSVQQDMEDAERDLSQFSSTNSVLDVKEQTKAMLESAATLQAQYMAAEAELQSLQQIYTPENVRVRSANARVNELKRQLEKIGGVEAITGSDAATSAEMYPSLKKLPLLGVRWADLYRRSKVEESLFELLTEQYELARIEEAKEIPTIKVIDPAYYPERRSFPPRTLIIVLVVLFGITAAASGTLLVNAWAHVPDDDLKKIIISEAGQQFRSLRRSRKFLKRLK